MVMQKNSSLAVDILLSSPVSVSLEIMLKDYLPEDVRIVSVDENHLFANTSDMDIIIAQIPTPVGVSNFVADVRSNILTQNVNADAMNAHQVHLKVILKSNTGQVFQEDFATLMLRLLVGVCSKARALGVHWGPANSIQDAQVFANLVSHLPQLPPLSQVTLAVRPAALNQETPNVVSLLVEGLSFYTGYNIGLTPGGDLTNDDVRTLLNLAEYFIQAKPVLKDGETLSVGNGANRLSWNIKAGAFKDEPLFLFFPSLPV